MSLASSYKWPVANMDQTHGSSSPQDSNVKSTTRLAASFFNQASGSSTVDSPAAAPAERLQLKEIPGGYGLPYIGPLKDRWEYFYFQGVRGFFEKRMAKYNSTVFRTNMPPGWPWTDPRCVILLDQKSYANVFDYDKVDKTDTFAGTFIPSLEFTGGLRMCAYLDPSDERHTKLKSYCLELLKESGPRWTPEFHKQMTNSFPVWEKEIASKGSSSFNSVCQELMFKVMIKAMTNVDIDNIPESDRPSSADLTKWTGLQLVPVLSVGLPAPIDDLVLHTAPLPFALARGGYDKMFKFLQKYAGEALDVAGKFDLNRDDATHNLIFFTILNGHGGFLRFFPIILKYVNTSAGLQEELKKEIRAAIETNGGVLNGKALESMSLVQSTVYEALRMEPPVPFQYARAKQDFVLESHDAAFRIKKGEMLGGVAYYASRDPVIFKDPNTFNPKRFLGKEGRKLLSHLIWSNGRQTTDTSTNTSSSNTKQCAARDLVPFLGQLFLVELFRKYEAFQISDVKPNDTLACSFLRLTPASSS